MRADNTFTLILGVFISTYLFGADATYQYGSYAGDDGASKEISGLAFNPEAVIVKGDGAYEAWFSTSDMTAGKAKLLNSGAVLSDDLMHTSGFGTNKFTVGTDDRANKLGVTYYWIAWDSSTDVGIGSYTGSGGFGTVTDETSDLPEVVWIFPDEANVSSFATTSAVRGDQSGKWTTQDNAGTADLWSFGAPGWTEGSNNNQSGIEYYFMAFNSSDDANMIHGSYQGNETDGKTITGFGSQPDVVFTFCYGGPGPVCFKTAAMSGNNGAKISNVALETDLIKTLDADGFTLGADEDANNTVAGVWNGYLAFKGGSQLPVELTSFRAQKVGETIEIKWETASEINSEFFIVEKSRDGVNFEEIMLVKGGGDSFNPIYYKEFDNNPFEGLNYYRLKQIDYDGTYEYFRTISVMYSNDNNKLVSQLYPNPSSAEVRFTTSFDQPYKVTVINELGQLVEQFQLGEQQLGTEVIINTKLYKPGNYVVRLEHPSKFSVVRRFTKL